MALINCPECGSSISEKAVSCPKCGLPLKPAAFWSSIPPAWRLGFEYKSQTEFFGWPLIHIAIGFNKDTGRLMAARGIIAVGQFGVGIITIAQFGIGLFFGFGQFVAGLAAVGQFAVGLLFGLGQFATGYTAIGQIAFGKYVRAMQGFGEYVWSSGQQDPEAVRYFKTLWQSITHLRG